MKLTTRLTLAIVILMMTVFIRGGDTPHRAWAQASTWHVAVDGSDVTGDGSEANPFATIQHGIDVAGDGDTVLVHPGVYQENIDFLGKDITVGSLFLTTGDEDYILQTVIDGGRNDHVVTFASGEDAAAELSGFTITNGYAHGAPWQGTYGGGVFCSDASPTLTYLKVAGNEAVGEGGGLYFGACSPTIHDVTVTNNLAGNGGGGLRFSYGSPSLENMVVAGNSAGSGGGLFFYHTNTTVANVLIADNLARHQNIDGGGGAIYFDGCSPTFVNVTVVGNSTAAHGGGLHISYDSQPTLVNSIVWGNAPEQIYYDTIWDGEAVTIEYSDIQGGEAGIVTNGQGPVYWLDGNMDLSPKFAHAGLGNYRLADGSPCISAGKAAGAPVTDIEGNPRPNPAGTLPDMGAYESPLGWGAVQFSSGTYSAVEGAGSAPITVMLSAASPLTVTVAYATADGTAVAGSDYLTATGTLTFTPGLVSQTFNVPILDDGIGEPAETVSLTLSGPVQAQLGAPATAVLTIEDDDGPVSPLPYSTFLGGSERDEAVETAIDSEGNVYIVGLTTSTDLPTTPDAYDGSYNGGMDAFVAKLSADGSTLLYSTYLGGSGEDIAVGVALDGDGNIYVTGHTYSVDFPTTPGAYDTTLGGGRDGFVAKLSADGSTLLYSTYLGGSNWDYGNCIAVDGTGSAYVGGFTHGSFPVTPGAAQTDFGGMGDGFVAKLSPDGGTMVYATYLGGWSWERNGGIAVNDEGNVYTVSGTPSDDFPTTPGAYDTVCESCLAGIGGDATVTKLSADGSSFVYSTFVGGQHAGNEDFFDVVVDSEGNAYLAGSSAADDFPTTLGALQPDFHGGGYDAIAAKLNANGSNLLYSTYLGGAGTERAQEMAVDSEGNAYVAGFTTSTDFPTAFPWQAANAGGWDTFAVELNQDASALLFGTYFGGSGNEYDEWTSSYIGFELSSHGVVIAGPTTSTDLPTTVGAYDTSFNGGAYDAFVAHLSPAIRAKIFLPLVYSSPSELLQVGLVSDVAGIDDAGFNQNTWAGLQRGQTELGVQVQFIESQSSADYEVNIAEFAEQGYDLVVTVGFLMGNATANMAAEYPNTRMTIMDYAYDPPIPNVAGTIFATDEAAFPAGYLAAGWAVLQDPDDPQVGWVGAMKIPPIEQFTVAYKAGAEYYNKQKQPAAQVQVKGVYVGDFDAPDAGRIQGQSLIDEGVDVIFGVGGKTGNGGLAAAKENGKWGVGVDVDQYFALPNEKDILLTSCLKRLDNGVFEVVRQTQLGYFPGGGVYLGILENEGVGLAPYHDLAGQIPEELDQEVQAVIAGIIAGEIDTGWPPFSAYDFYGSLDELKVFGRSLTQEEVLALYNQGR